MQKYDHKLIEEKWRKIWEGSGVYKTGDNPAKPKYYVMDMFPYPSGAGLHVGHPKGYIATDVVARMKMMQGFNVLHPMGWDAFGLPAENYALKNKVHPRAATEQNVATFKQQLGKLGFSYDWEREINTTDPEFYKWTQWIFLEMFKRGLAYESYEPIIWCPSCKTGLAMEDLEGGKCERCGSDVERKPMRQWVLKITDYADRLLDDIDKLDQWEPSIKEMQRNWIGRSDGAMVKFSIRKRGAGSGEQENSDQVIGDQGDSISGSPDHQITELPVFTTRPDTLFGATYMVVAPEHEMVGNLKSEIGNWDEILTYIEQAKKKSELERAELQKDKTGVELKGIKAVNPVNGEEIPVFVADYVLSGYGTGAIMAVPAHDGRDWEFAKKYGLEVREVVKCNTDMRMNADDADTRINAEHACYVGEGVSINSGLLDGLSTKEAKEKMIKWLEEKGVGKRAVNYKLKDWVFSRQRYWGEPIPISYCEVCRETVLGYIEENKIDVDALKREGISNFQYPITKQILNHNDSNNNEIPNTKYQIPFTLGELLNPGWIPDDRLPIELPDVESYEPTGTGESPLANIAEWVNTTCPKCGGPAKRETNTMPQWAGSSWYYLRYIDPKNDQALVGIDKEKYWSPVDLYVGGAEHATRHLIYARFWHKFLFDIGAVAHDEPFTRLQHVGLILAEDGRKMSKRWGNVINPDEVVEKYGADAMRVYEMFMGPFAQACAWNTNGLIGTRRFLERIYKMRDHVISDQGELIYRSPDQSITSSAITNLLHKTIKKVTEDIAEFKFNTAVAALMILVNEMEKEEKISREHFGILVKLIAPFAPHLAEELWISVMSDHVIGDQGELQSDHPITRSPDHHNKDSVFQSSWPSYDPSLIIDETIELVLQVNGKVRDRVEVAVDISEEEAKKLALDSETVKKWLDGKEPKKVVYVKGKLVNVVI